MLNGRDGALDLVAGGKRRLQLDRGQRLQREPGLAAAAVGDDERLLVGRLGRPRQQHAVAGELTGLRGRAVGGRRGGEVAGLQARHLGPIDLRARIAQHGLGGAADRLALACLAELLQRQAAPQVGGGGVPGAAALAGDEAAGQAAQVVLPGRVVQHGEQQARAVDVATGHQPPPVVGGFGAEDHARALVRQPRTQHLLCFL